MKRGNLLGVAIPLGIILIFVFLEMINVGITEETTFLSSLAHADVFPDKITSNNCSYAFTGNKENYLVVMEQTISNSFFLPKKTTLDRYAVCAVQEIKNGYFTTEFVAQGTAKQNEDVRMRRTADIGPGEQLQVNLALAPKCSKEYQRLNGSTTSQSVYIEPSSYEVSELVVYKIEQDRDSSSILLGEFYGGRTDCPYLLSSEQEPVARIAITQ
ncbi:MAG: hypothetical protein H6502_02230 [Candidatus Woesearchaeota archaeon]|nr:MAG: hypothetical protein H6502_02230 [Candidatus Woesearchaeota archaeon]